MWRTTLAGLRAHPLRLTMTALAVILGVGFVSGTFVLTDTMRAGFGERFTASADRVSVAVLPGKGGRREIPAPVLRTVRSVPGVVEAHGQVRGDAALIGRDGRAYGEMPTVGLSIGTGPPARYPITTGRAPGAPGDIVLDVVTARRAKFGVGDSVRVLDHRDVTRTFTVTGLVDFGVDQEIGFRGAVGFILPVAAEMTGERGFAEIDVRAAPGVSDGRLRTAVSAAVGPSFTTLTGGGLAERIAAASRVDTDQVAMFLLTFALVALFVSALVIYNTFNILITQRVREMALLRCVGATRSQVFRAVLAESAVVGLVASTLGAFAGIGLGTGAATFFDARAGSTGGGAVVSATPFLVGIPVGLVVTVLSALLPARAATRVPPVAALRARTDGAVGGRAGITRTVTGFLLGVTGLALGGVALYDDPGEGPFVMVVVGGFLVFCGVIALSPLTVWTLSGVVGAVPARLFGVPGRLALENSRRNPRRAAITTIALTVGVTLMTMFSVALSSTRATMDARLTRHFPVDYQLRTQSGGDAAIPREVAGRLRAMPRFAEVIEVRQAPAVVNGHRGERVGTVTQRYLGRTVKPRVEAGSLAGLRPGSVVLRDRRANPLGAAVGGSISVDTGHRTMSLRVAAIISGEDPVPDILLDERDFRDSFGDRPDHAVYLVLRKGVSADASRAAVDEATKGHPRVTVHSVADLKAQFTKSLDMMFLLVAGLLAIAVIISLIGIANTLTLSVVERTRETALLRALGVTRRGLRRMLSLEALIIAVIGALIGVVLGMVLGWAATSATFDDVVVDLPVARILLFVVVAGAAGVLAATLPGRRAARASIVESLAAD